jgi:outer membrane autotransporter protein
VSLSSGSVTISESGGGAILGVGYDVRVGNRWYLSPFANAIGYSIDGESWDVFQFGVGLGYH